MSASNTNTANPGRPRSPDTDEAILAAARTLLTEGGYEGLTYEAIGKLTGIGRPTIYRRWPTKAHLAAAIAYGDGQPLPNTEGDLRSRLKVLVGQVHDLYCQPEIAAASVGLISTLWSAPELRAELHTPAETSARTQLREMIEVALEGGEVRPTADPDVLFDMLVGALVFRLIFSSKQAHADLADQLAEHLYLAIAKSGAGNE